LAAWKAFITETIILAHQAGLNHQMDGINNTFGMALNPVFAELGLQNRAPL
jgi:hypothetical protein